MFLSNGFSIIIPQLVGATRRFNHVCFVAKVQTPMRYAVSYSQLSCVLVCM